MVKGKALNAVRFLKNRLILDGIKVNDLIVYGSHAKGHPGEESDIDILIISEDFIGKDIFERARITMKAERETVRRFCVPLDIITLTPKEYEDGNSLVVAYAADGMKL